LLQQACLRKFCLGVFVGKRLINLIGFAYGNLIQAVLFGLIHGVLLVLVCGELAGVVAVVLLTGVMGYLVGYINEKKGNGSIVPGWVAHSLANVMSISPAWIQPPRHHTLFYLYLKSMFKHPGCVL